MRHSVWPAAVRIVEPPLCSEADVSEEGGSGGSGGGVELASDFVNTTSSSNATSVVIAIHDDSGDGDSGDGDGVDGAQNATISSAECITPYLFSTAYDRERHCVAGCCVDGACVCRAGFNGFRCQYQLQCVVVPSLTAASPQHGRSLPGAPCVTQRVGDSLVLCACQQIGLVGVIRYRFYPSIHIPTVPTSASRLGALLAHLADSWLFLLLPLAYALAISLATALDRRTLFVGEAELPWWLDSRRPFSMRQDVIRAAREHSALLRLLSVVPDHTRYTHAQLTHLLFAQWANHFAVNAALLRIDHCITVAALLASICAVRVLSRARTALPPQRSYLKPISYSPPITPSQQPLQGLMIPTTPSWFVSGDCQGTHPDRQEALPVRAR